MYTVREMDIKNFDVVVREVVPKLNGVLAKDVNTERSASSVEFDKVGEPSMETRQFNETVELIAPDPAFLVS